MSTDTLIGTVVTSRASAARMPTVPGAVRAAPESRRLSCQREGSAVPAAQTRARNTTGFVPLTRARTASAPPGCEPHAPYADLIADGPDDTATDPEHGQPDGPIARDADPGTRY